MRFVTYHTGDNAPRLGRLDGELIHPLAGQLVDLIAATPDDAAAATPIGEAFPRAGATLLAPIPHPARNIFCVGKNYHEHAEEFHRSGFDASAGKDAIPEFPIIFTKASTTVIATGEAIPSMLDPTNSVDYEGELAVVIGPGGRGISRSDAMQHVFGYTIVNDVTSRMLQSRHKQWFIGKNLDGFCPMGPIVVTADEVPDPGSLRLQTFVNGEARQDTYVRQLIFDIPSLIEILSATMTLMPGDIIATGTCAGVGIGFDPPRFLHKGDSVRVEISGIGFIENPVD